MCRTLSENSFGNGPVHHRENISHWPEGVVVAECALGVGEREIRVVAAQRRRRRRRQEVVRAPNGFIKIIPVRVVPARARSKFRVRNNEYSRRYACVLVRGALDGVHTRLPHLLEIYMCVSIYACT